MELRPYMGQKASIKCLKCGYQAVADNRPADVFDPFESDNPRDVLNEYQTRMLLRNWRNDGFGKRYQRGVWSNCGARESIRAWHNDGDSGLLISGSIGTGKTVALGLMMTALAARNEFSFAFWHVSSLLSFLHSWRGWGENFAHDESVRNLRNCKYLFLDDLGVEYNSPFAMARFHEIVEYRYASEKYFCATSNLREGELSRREGWERIIDRIQENAIDWLELGGESKRRVYANA